MDHNHDFNNNRDQASRDRQNVNDDSEEHQQQQQQRQQQQQPNSNSNFPFVVSGHPEPTLYAAMQTIITRVLNQHLARAQGTMNSQGNTNSQAQPTAASQNSEPPPSEGHDENNMPLLVPVTDVSTSTTESSQGSSSIPQNPSEHHPIPTESVAGEESNESSPEVATPETNANQPPGSRPIRPLPRPHAHIHAHTPGGSVIDLYAYNVGDVPPPPLPGTASFTFNIGPEGMPGFENPFFFNLFNGGFMSKDLEPDFERARTLLREMEVVPKGLVRRLERTGGVPGAQGGEEYAGCAVCYGPLLENVESGEWDNAQQKAAKEKAKQDDSMNVDDEEFQGWIVGLPCAHVFHAECLLPWFARNTTCPTCRFDIDPDSLTWNPQPLPAPPAESVAEPVAEPNLNAGPRPNPNITEAGPIPNIAIPAFEEIREQTLERLRQANIVEAARFNAFIESVFRARRGEETQPDDNQMQPQPSENAQEAPSSSSQVNEPELPSVQPQPPISPLDALRRLQQPRERTVFGPAPPQQPPPPVHAIPAIFRMPMPMFVIPTAQQQQQQQPQPEARPQQEAQPGQEPQPFPLPQPHPQPHPQLRPHPQPDPYAPAHTQPLRYAQPHPHPHAQPHTHAQPHAHAQQPQSQPEARVPPHTDQGHAPIPVPFPFSFPFLQTMNDGVFPLFMGQTQGQTPQQQQQPRRKWAPPDPVGKTLRQRVEAKEREIGLRCDDPICGLGPEDDDEPIPITADTDAGASPIQDEVQQNMKRIKLRAAYDGHGRACEHEFHPECLVRSSRVSGTRDTRPLVLNEGKEESADVLAQCSVCRAEGWLWKEEWEEGCKPFEELH